jgi:diguanylate cyclase (GGDEF)-like protein
MALGLGAAFIHLVEKHRTEAARRAAADVARDEARSVEREVDRAFRSVSPLAAVLAQFGRIPDFDSLARNIFGACPAIASLQLAPGGIVREVRPEGAAPEGLGHDLWQDRALSATLAAATGSRDWAVVGPVSAGSKGSILLAYRPVFLADQTRGDVLWGFVVAELRLRDLLRGAGMEHLAARGFHHHLSARADGSHPLILSRSTEGDLSEPVEAPIKIPAGSWTLAVAPVRGWRSLPLLATEVALALVVALVASLSAHRLLREPEILRQEVERRARRLSDAHRQLKEEVIQRQATEELLAHGARHDPLTSLPNRAELLDRVQRALDRGQHVSDSRFAVLFADLDRFKHVNDSLGPAMGDRLLVEIAGRLEAGVRPGDLVSRVGGDEFASLLWDVAEVGTAVGVAERLLKEMRRPFDLGGEEVFAEVSIGVAMGGPAYKRADELLRDAETAMHDAKSQGRSRCIVFDDRMRARAVAIQRLETDLRRAIEREEFFVHYQPIVSLESGRIVGCEALARWRHPVRGLVQPADFIPLAEENGQIIWIDRWVLGASARATRAWQVEFPSEPPLTISVNLSGKQLAQPRLVEDLQRIIGDAELDPRTLKLEITESSVMQNAEAALEILERLRGMGVQLLIDDFGTGYSSLSYLQRFPFHTVKIDQSFVKTMHTNAKNREIVETIVSLSRKLGMTVLAEGVETAEQVAQLRRAGCGYGQGYFFSRPIDGDAFRGMLLGLPPWAAASRKTSGA